MTGSGKLQALDTPQQKDSFDAETATPFVLSLLLHPV